MNKQSLNSFQHFHEAHFTKNIIYKNSNSNVFVLNFLPGQQMPSHYHYGAELYFHVLEGTGAFHFDGNDLVVSHNDVIWCDGFKKVGFTNTGNENVSIYVTLSKVKDEDFNI